MPEGPEVKTVAKTLREKLVGQELGTLWHSHLQLRKQVDFAMLAKLKNSRIDDVYAYGKVLFINIDQKPAIFAQLGMTGQLKVEPQKAPLLAHTHIRWPLKNSALELRYVDPRRFGLFDRCNEALKDAIIKKLGPDPFTMSTSDVAPLITAMAKSTRAIKEVLLDQSVIAGVGNIYASEALFLAGIHPETKASAIAKKHYEKLIDAVGVVMRQALANAGTSFSNYVDGSGKKGDNLQFLQVFQRDKEPCKKCGTIIERIKQGGRSTFFCPRCQF